jgi:RND family efflux transporter MFP subunit
MKKLLYITTILLLAACDKPTDKASQLADLKKQQADINQKISAIEKTLPKKDSVKTVDVSTVAIKAGNFTNYVQIQGKIDAQDNVTAFPQVQANITSIFVKAGDHVNKGQVIVDLDKSVINQNIEQAETQSNLNAILYQKQKNLWDQKIGTEVQYLQIKAAYEASLKQVASLKKQAELYRIVSPITGTVDQMDLKIGQFATPSGNNNIRIVNGDLLKVKADVPESYASRINQGDLVLVSFPDVNDSLKAKVTFAAKAIDPASRSFGVEIKLPANKKLRPNMTAILKIADYSNNKAIVVPINSIQRSEAGDYVFVNEGGIAKRKSVKLGAPYGGNTEILSGLTAGDQLITLGGTEVEEGDKVNVLNQAN